jgi:succinylarginine dihydrolase
MSILPRFSTETSTLLYSFLEQIFAEAQTRNELACMALKDKDHIKKRKALLLEKDFRDLLDDGVFGKDVLKVTNMKDVGNVTDGEFASDNVWIRHLRSFERIHDVAFESGIDKMIDEWTRLNNTPGTSER